MGFLILFVGLGSAWPATPGAREPHDYPDSLRSLPPRMRPFFDQEYRRQAFNAPLQESLNVRCVGRWPWGPSYEVTAQRDTLYLASGSGVRIVDITTPTNPRHIGQVCAKGLVSQVVIRDSLLYVASRGLEIFNVSNPASPVKRSWLDIPVSDFGLKDSFAACIADSLRIIKIKDPGNPIRVGASADSGYAISVTNNYAYIGSRWELAIINITNPQNPRRAGSRGAYVHSLWVQGNHCYTTTGNQGFTIFNIRDSSNIWEEGRIGTLWSYDVYVIGNFAYTPNFAVVDISDSSSPTIVGSVNMPCGPFGVWVKSPFTYGFVADNYEGLQAVNINDPTQPRIDTAAFGADAARDVFVQGNRAYIADDHSGMKVLDISNIAAPFEIGSYDTIGPRPSPFEALWVRDTVGYLGTDVNFNPPRQFVAVNVSTPSSIRRLGSCEIPNNIECADMFLKNGDSILYSANQSYLFGFRVNNPTAPALVCSLRLGADEAYGVFAKDSFAYVEGTTGGLKIVNIGRPSNPTIVGRCSTHYGLAVYVRDTVGYVGGGTLGLVIVNVANASASFEISRFPTRHWAVDVWVKDSLAFVDARAFVQIVNVKDPRNPFETGYYQFYSPSRRLFHDGNYVYTANYEGGVYVLEQFTTAISENPGQERLIHEVTVTPNPVRGKLMLQLGLATIHSCFRIFDIGGREVIGKKRLNPTPISAEIDVGGLKAGVYFIILEDRMRRKVVKIVKI